MSAQGINALGRAIFGRLPFCAIPGALAGVITGSFFSVAEALHPVQLTIAEVVVTGVVLGLIGLVAVLVVLVLLFRYTLLPALVNALIVGVVVVAVLNWVQRPPLGPLLGFVIGLVVGALLCFAACRILRWEARI